MEISRFKELLESSLGNVKPLLTEATAANAGEIQKFLQLNQDKTIVVDYNFGPKSATAAGKYIFRGTNKKDYNSVTTVKRLWELMKAENLDVGTTPGFGPKMAAALAKLLDQSKVNLDAWYASQKKATTTTTTIYRSAAVADNTYVAPQNLYHPGKI